MRLLASARRAGRTTFDGARLIGLVVKTLPLTPEIWRGPRGQSAGRATECLALLTLIVERVMVALSGLGEADGAMREVKGRGITVCTYRQGKQWASVELPWALSVLPAPNKRLGADRRAFGHWFFFGVHRIRNGVGSICC